MFMVTRAQPAGYAIALCLMCPGDQPMRRNGETIMTQWVAVTEDDIATGERHDARYCPLARALRRATGRSVSVGTRSATVWDASGMSVMDMTARTERFRHAFDSGQAVKPGRYAFRVSDS